MAVEEAIFKANSKRPWPMKKHHEDDAVKMGGRTPVRGVCTPGMRVPSAP